MVLQDGRLSAKKNSEAIYYSMTGDGLECRRECGAIILPRKQTLKLIK